MAWRTFSVSTADWQTKVMVTPSKGPWARALDTGRTGTDEFNVSDPEVAKTATEANLAEWERLIVREFFGKIVYAGFITDCRYNKNTGRVTVDHEDIYSVWRKRVMANMLSNGVQTRPPLAYTGVSRLNLIKQAFYEGQNDAPRFNIPIVLPPDEAGALTKVYDPWALPTVADIVEDEVSTEDGPNVDLFPRWRDDGSIEWLLRGGDLNDGEWSWMLDVEKPKATNLLSRSAGKKMANRIVAVGEGSEKNMLLHVEDGSATSSFLPLDEVISYKGEKDPIALAARARADLAARSKPTKQVSMDVQMDETFSVDMLRLGDTVNWHTQNDPWYGTGWHSSRLIEFSGDLTDKVHLEFQEIGG